MPKDYKDLLVWQNAMELVTEIYKQTSKFPKQEQFGLTSQLRRAAVSVPSNIAEGQGRRTGKEFKHFLGNARGSLLEVETQVLIAHNLTYIENENAQALKDKILKTIQLLNGLMRSIDRRENQ